MNAENIKKFVSILKTSRDYAELAHTSAVAYSVHMHLNEFYEDLAEQIDLFVETCQGRLKSKINALPMDNKLDIKDPELVLSAHLNFIESSRYDAVGENETALQSIIDDIVVIYLHALYKIRELK